MKTSIVYNRGNPDGRTLNGKEQELVHLMMPAYADGTREEYPACFNGAFNMRCTKQSERVTCPKCRATFI